MTRTYAAKRLLEHGPLTAREFIEITGWPVRRAYQTLEQIIVTGVAVFYYEQGTSQRRYRLC